MFGLVARDAYDSLSASLPHLDTGRPGFIRAALAPVCSTTDVQSELQARAVAALRPVRRGEPWRPVRRGRPAPATAAGNSSCRSMIF
jgi:hypothetical protein